MLTSWNVPWEISGVISCHAIVIRIFFVSKGLNEVLTECLDVWVLLLELVDRDGIGDSFD